jgi:hypothetical protein
MNKQKRKAFSLKDKYDIIKKIQSGVKQSSICHEMNLTKSTVCTIWKKREQILSSYGKVNYKCKKIRKSAHEVVDKEPLKWLERREENPYVVSATEAQNAIEMEVRKEFNEFNVQ